MTIGPEAPLMKCVGEKFYWWHVSKCCLCGTHFFVPSGRHGGCLSGKVLPLQTAFL
jgi:hypothetical protein